MFRILLEGEYALFSRPEFKVERVTYEVPTPSAVAGILKSVYWKPAIRYVVDRIVVFHPINLTSVRRNEVKEKVLFAAVRNQMKGGDGDPTIYTKDCISQRSSLLLKDVKYGVEFHFELTGVRSEKEEQSDAKHASILKRRLENGQCFRQPCFGCREFPVRSLRPVDEFDLAEVDPSLRGERDLGVMLYGLNFRDDTRLSEDWNPAYFSDCADPVFYHPKMVDGVIDVARYREEIS